MVIVALLGGVLFCGLATVARFHVWAEIDESAHYAYIQTVAENGHLPRIDDFVSPQVQAISQNRWPRPPLGSPEELGLAGRNYEAFQPPLYYLVATPAFAVGGDHRDKVFAVRAFDLALLGLLCLVLFRMARRQLPEAPAVAFAGGIGVMLLPGVLVRGVTISNSPLEMLLATTFLAALERAWRRSDVRWMPAAGLLLGACLLTKLTLIYLAVPFGLSLWFLRRSLTTRSLVAAVLAPIVLIAPWLIANLIRLGSFTANAAARDQQSPWLFPNGNHLGLADLPDKLWALTDGFLPQEWRGQLDLGLVRAVGVALLAGLVLATVGAAARRGSSVLARLSLSALFAYIVMAAVTLAIWQWDVFLLRYAYPVLPVMGVAAATYFWQRFGARVAVMTTCGWLVLVAGLWVHLAGEFYFTDLGRQLGI